MLPKLVAFANAANACKAAGLKLSDIDVIFSGSKGAQFAHLVLPAMRISVIRNTAPTLLPQQLPNSLSSAAQPVH